MNAFAWLAIHDVACVSAAVILIITNHPGWAFWFLLLAATTTVKNVEKM